jgi:hydroxymethylglutaryl-CoA synthase
MQSIGEDVVTQLRKACALRIKAYGSKSYKPLGDVASLASGTYYLENIDEVYRRTYAIKHG